MRPLWRTGDADVYFGAENTIKPHLPILVMVDFALERANPQKYTMDQP